jgi:hypothetical protein
MLNLHKELTAFHNNHVRLGREKKQMLAGYRDVNLERLNDGLAKLGDEDGREYARPVRHCNQGSYATHTIIQQQENDYDIDVAIIFRKDDLPSGALDARKRIEAALQKGGGNFARPPEARTNAVTVWYKEGYHIDFAVYREYKDQWGEVILEHAGADWTPRDPMEITNWFNDQVHSLSPSGEYGAVVDAGQMRRIVRLLKAFARSRASWELPGGLIISALVAEKCQPDDCRDDISLYNTMAAIRDRLLVNLDVPNPVDGSQTLTYKDEYTNQVRRLRDRLGDAINHLHVLLEPNCARTDAMKAWHRVLNHSFWIDSIEEVKAASTACEYLPDAPYMERLGIVVGVAKERDGRIVREHPSGGGLCRGCWLRFTIDKNNTSVQGPYQIRWIVKNHGREAEEADDLGPRFDGTEEVQWESTKYEGTHTMTCEIHNGKVVLARTRHLVKIE